jgi:putative transposase
MKELAAVRVRYGYRRIRILLNREGWQAGKYLVYRLYKEEGLALRKKLPKRRKMVVQRETRFRPTGENQAWSLDFVSDQLSDGKKIRALTVVDVFTREALAIDIGYRLRGGTCHCYFEPACGKTSQAEMSVCRQRERVHRACG